MSRKKLLLFFNIINHLLTKLVQSRWLDIGFMFLAFLWPLTPSRLINMQKKNFPVFLTSHGWSITHKHIYETLSSLTWTNLGSYRKRGTFTVIHMWLLLDGLWLLFGVWARVWTYRVSGDFSLYVLQGFPRNMRVFSASMVSRRNPPLLECMLPYIVRSNLEVNYLCRLESTLLRVVMLFEELSSISLVHLSN